MKWIKPDGAEIETNDAEATIAKAKELGWKEKKARRKSKSADAAPPTPPAAEAE